MDIVVTGRKVTISSRFREHVDSKLAKIESLAPKIHRVDVVVTHEPHGPGSERVEITCHGKGPVIRGEASASDKTGAFDVALERVVDRVRRAQDRRRVHRGRRTPESVAEATSRIAAPSAPIAAATSTAAPISPVVAEPSEAGQSGPGAAGNAFADGDSPIEVREKLHSSGPMTVEEALTRMELVGHDFYLYHDVDTDQPSVVYHRRGWSYGVIRLEVQRNPAQVP